MQRLLCSGNAIGKLLGVLGVTLSLAACGGRGASPEEQASAHAALERWDSMKPDEYTFVIVPENLHSNVTARIRVKHDAVINQETHDGAPHVYAAFTMTDALQEAIDTAAQEERFAGAYDPMYGYLVWFDVPSPDRNTESGTPGSGVDITCFERNIGGAACNDYF